MISEPVQESLDKFRHLVETGALSEAGLTEAATGAAYRGVDVERILRHEYHIPRRRLLESLSAHYGCPWVEYDERVPIPFELLCGLNASSVCRGRWFPVAKDHKTAVIATADPNDPDLPGKVKACVPAESYEFRVALPEDVQSFIEDFLNEDPRHLIGNERTSLAFWRNTLARWRTRLACYRTEFAKVRTNLGFLSGGMGLIAIGRTLLRLHPSAPVHHFYFYWGIIGLGLGLVAFGLYHYMRIKGHVLRPPRHQTVVEVTSATLYFLENYQFTEYRRKSEPFRKTMLARLAELPKQYDVVVDQSRDNKKRSYLAHQRNLLSAQRTIAACYRTVYSRARTGLAFIRAGVSFLAVGIGLVKYFGFSLLTALDMVLILGSIGMIVDGALWYLPARREQAEIPEYLIRPSLGRELNPYGGQAAGAAPES
ncbi:MAG: hypothetical protein ACM3KE_09870 [Hyphomicrobiales bacterium]